MYHKSTTEKGVPVAAILSNMEHFLFSWKDHQYLHYMLVTSEVNKHYLKILICWRSSFSCISHPQVFRYEELYVKMQNSPQSSHNIREEFNLDGVPTLKLGTISHSCRTSSSDKINRKFNQNIFLTKFNYQCVFVLLQLLYLHLQHLFISIVQYFNLPYNISLFIMCFPFICAIY